MATPHCTGIGKISFGLMNVGVKLYAAHTSAGAIELHQLHAKCHSRVKQQLVCPTDGEVVPREDLAKGYEYARDRFVTFTAAELAALDGAADRTVRISELLPLAGVDPIWLDGSATYLTPERGSELAYATLVGALWSEQLAAVAVWNGRGVVLVRPLGRALVMQGLRHRHQVRLVDELPVLPQINVSGPEVRLAVELLSQHLVASYDPVLHPDVVHERMRALIEARIPREPLVAPRPPKRAKRTRAKRAPPTTPSSRAQSRDATASRA